MSRPKLEVNEVFILSECLPYEGDSIIGVFISPEAAMDARPNGKGRWKKVTHDGETYWTTGHLPGEEMHKDPWFIVGGYPVRTK